MRDEILLWLFVIFSGLAVGAGLYEMRINVPRWFRRSDRSGMQIDAAAMRADDSGRRFWVYLTTVPLTLLTLASLYVAWQPQTPGHTWWLIAAVVTLAERIMALSYFIPSGLKLMRAEGLPPEKVEGMASQWVTLNYVRGALGLIGWLLALKALSLLAGAPPASGQSHAGTPVAPAVASPAALGPGFVSQTLDARGTTLHYVRGGSGPLVILIHGYPQDWWEWRHIMPKLGDRFTVVAVDLRGVGESKPTESGYDAPSLAEDVRAIVQALNAGAPYVVGHDIGGMVAYAYARLYPESTRGAMIMDVGLPGLEPWSEAERLPLLWHFHFHSTPRLPEALVEGRQFVYFREFIRRFTLNPDAISDADVAHFARSYGSPERLRAGFEFYRAFDENAQFNTAHREPLQTPLVLVGGEHSAAMSNLKLAESLRAYGVQAVAVEVIKNARHYLAEEQPDVVVELITRYAEVK